MFGLLHRIELPAKKTPTHATCETHGIEPVIFYISDPCSDLEMYFNRVTYITEQAEASHLVSFHGFTNSVTGSVMNDLQPLVNGGLEPVMKARQRQHFSVPVGEDREDFL